jgi:NADH dehydrogenase [ubiquinone] 1 alpha subcomplex assembly factor 7
VAGAAGALSARQRVNALARLLAARIRESGPLTIADYMEAALAHPEHGYYRTRDPFGARGDFITAPEISQMFGELIGLWCVDVWRRMGEPGSFVLADLGPGRGTLMSDALRAAKLAPDFLAGARLHLVETSPALRMAQGRTLGAHGPQWHERAEDLPDGPILMVANEFFDALPVRQFIRREKGWHERRIGLGEDGETFVFTLDPTPNELEIPPISDSARLGAIREVASAALALAAWLGARIAREGGVGLIVDYGYYPSACGDTLQALRAHRPHGVLDDPGEADLTAHVDFRAVADAARTGGARAWGPVPQRDFLHALGIAERAPRLLAAANPAQAADIAGAYRRLVDPFAMGSLFKVLAVTHPAFPALAGFAEEPA